ncbi:DUF2157 domain-containing protein [Amycolatopsis benzoatilytica]|uniref:DUF2157 domain-containing protein n=1 Tax=Amycolatopsis benzoatilytica TaxID=346045 RepID=UPI00035FB957|nr:DUF2157 domain-containing protein [Amycolatopsis benzoatilytica]
MTNESPVRETLRGLVQRTVLSEEQAAEVERALRDTVVLRRLRVPWAEVAGYLGGALVLAGAVLLVATTWARWPGIARTTVCASAAALLFAGGFVAVQGISGLISARTKPSSARLRVAATLFALAAGATAITIGIALPDDAGSAGVAIACGSGAVLSGIAYALVPSVPGLLTTVGLLVATVLAGMDATVGTTALRAGIAITVIGLLLVGASVGQALRHRLAGAALGAFLSLVGAQQPLGEHSTVGVAYGLTFALGVAFLALYRWKPAWVLLVAGVLGITLAVPEAVWNLTGGATGAAVIVLIAGAVLLVASALGFRLRHGPATRISGR